MAVQEQFATAAVHMDTASFVDLGAFGNVSLLIFLEVHGLMNQL